MVSYDAARVMQKVLRARYQGVEGTATVGLSPSSGVYQFIPNDPSYDRPILSSMHHPAFQVSAMDEELPVETNTIDGAALLLDYLATCAKTSYPDEAARIMRGVQIVHNGTMLLHDDGTATVMSSSGDGHAYTVTATSCTCPDATERQMRCKHRWARMLAHRMMIRARQTWYAVRNGQQGIVMAWGDSQGVHRSTWACAWSGEAETDTQIPDGCRLGGRLMLTGVYKMWKARG